MPDIPWLGTVVKFDPLCFCLRHPVIEAYLTGGLLTDDRFKVAVTKHRFVLHESDAGH